MEKYFYDPKIKFANRMEAARILNRLTDVAVQYGHATVRDLYEISGFGYYANASDRLFGWSAEEIDAGSIYTDAGYNGNIIISIRLPAPKKFDIPEDNNDDLEDDTTYDQKLLSIVIHVNKIDLYDPDEIVSSVFKHVSQIKDRTINITIM